MNNNPLYSEFAAQFAAASLSSLVESFNSQVGNRGWSSARAAHNRALIDELIHRGIDVSSVFDGSRTSFAHHVELTVGQSRAIGESVGCEAQLDVASSKLVVLD